jgi:putative ABC transport system permease protein
VIKNYFKTAWRNLISNKAFSFINIAGLALGLSCSLLIFLWVRYEKSVDGFHKNSKQLFQVYERNYFDGKVEASYPTQVMLAHELKRVIPQIQYACGFEYASAPGTKSTFQAGDNINKMNGMFAGADFFKMFSFPLIDGNVNTAISDPGSIAISQTMADDFFGSAQKAIGKIIRFENKEDLKITAVFKDIPANSSLQFDFLRSWTDFIAQNKDWVYNWGDTDPQTFIQIRKGANVREVQSAIKDFIYNYQPKTKGLLTELALQPFSERYLYSNFKNGYINGGRIEYVRLFSIIAIFILLIACINFMNLATARSARRAKEVGIRKVAGAMRGSLIRQFLAEAIMVTLLSIIIALVIVIIVLPVFNQLTGKPLSLPWQQPYCWLGFLGLLVVTGLVAGSYPAFFMSSFKPVRILKGSLKFSQSNKLFRKGLVVFQFSLSIMLIMATIVIYNQMHYVMNKDLGYDKDNLVYIPIEGDLVKNFETFKNAALANTAIVDISKMRNSPSDIEHHTNSISWPGKDPNLNVFFADGVVGYDFVKTMHLQLLEGRDFSKAYTDSASFLLNETAVRTMGLKNPIGSTIYWGGHQGTVIGVIKDFNFNSLHQAIEPLIIRLDENWSWGTILVRIKATQTSQALTALQKICKQLNPAFPFTYHFADREYASLYDSEQVVSRLSDIFALLAMIISCLGLFGLAMFSAEQRTKEIGIRKVLGASYQNILALLSANFLQPVAIALFIAFPVAWIVMQRWLQNYYYRITISWWIFAFAGMIAIFIALITISFQAIKAALANPVNSLRTE